MTENQTPAAQATTTAKKVTTRHCNCGCGEATSSSKTAYKPGHDARHAGQVARAMAAAKINGDSTYSPALDTLPSPKLRSKAEAMAKRIVEQVATKASKAARKPTTRSKSDAADAKAAATLAEKVQAEEAAHAEALAAEVALRRADIEAQDEAEWAETFPVKIGRWTYPTRQSTTGTQERNTKRDGSGEWIAYEG